MPAPHHPEANRRFPDDPPTFSQRDPIDTMPAGSFTSSNVHSGLYDFGNRELYLRYKRDGPDAIYQYWDVDASTWQSLLAASSKGEFVNEAIAFEYEYALFGRDEFPDDGRGIDNALARRFVTTA